MEVKIERPTGAKISFEVPPHLVCNGIARIAEMVPRDGTWTARYKRRGR